MAEQQATQPPDDIITEFENELIGHGTVRVDRSELWAIWNQVDVAWAGTWASRPRLSYALDKLASNTTIELPVRGGRLWDQSIPPLPNRVALPANRRSVGTRLDPATEPWTTLLQWVPGWIREASPPQRLRIAAAQINRWLLRTTGQPRPRVAREERSLHIFNNEKTLAALSSGALFAPGRLKLDQLACDAPLGSLRIARLARTGPVLIVENKSTFDSAWRALRAAQESPYAAVVFGGGDAAAALVDDLANLDVLLDITASTYHYAGDVDIAGVEAAASLSRDAVAIGLHVEMATRLWDAVAQAEPTGEDLTAEPGRAADAIAVAKSLGLPASVNARINEGVRVPQERIDRNTMADLRWWTP